MTEKNTGKGFVAVLFTGIAAGFLMCGPVNAAEESSDDSWRLNIGLRAWSSNWTTWSPGLDPNPTEPGDQDVRSVDFKTRVAVIPQLSLQVHDFFMSTSYFVSTKYEGVGRKEFDVNAGYYVVPSLALSLGYKSINQDFGNYKFTGPTVGVSGSVPLSNNFGVYANFAYGMFDAKYAGEKYDATYVLTEPGLSYSFLTNNAAGLDAVVLTLGYRFQTLKTKDANFNSSLRDSTQGITFGIVGSF